MSAWASMSNGVPSRAQRGGHRRPAFRGEERQGLGGRGPVALAHLVDGAHLVRPDHVGLADLMGPGPQPADLGRHVQQGLGLAQLLHAVAQGLLGQQPVADVLGLDDEVQRCAGAVAHQGGDGVRPDGAPALVQKALVTRVVIGLPCQQNPALSQVFFQIVGMDGFGQRQTLEFVFRIAQKTTKCPVDPQATPIRPDQSHADGRVLEGTGILQ